MREGLADGTIDIVATDHAPHPVEDKDCEWAAAAFGMLGLETALSVVQQTMVDTGLLTGRTSPTGCPTARRGSAGSPTTAGRSRWARRPTSCWSTPRPRGPSSRAELGVAARNTPFAGMELPGRVVATFLRGRPTVLDGKLR